MKMEYYGMWKTFFVQYNIVLQKFDAFGYIDSSYNALQWKSFAYTVAYINFFLITIRYY